MELVLKSKYFTSVQYVNGRLGVPCSGVILPKNIQDIKSIRYHENFVTVLRMFVPEKHLYTYHVNYCKIYVHYQENIVKVGPAIDENTGKASLKAKPILDTKEDNGSHNYALNVSTGW